MVRQINTLSITLYSMLASVEAGSLLHAELHICLHSYLQTFSWCWLSHRSTQISRQWWQVGKAAFLCDPGCGTALSSSNNIF